MGWVVGEKLIKKSSYFRGEMDNSLAGEVTRESACRAQGREAAQRNERSE